MHCLLSRLVHYIFDWSSSLGITALADGGQRRTWSFVACFRNSAVALIMHGGSLYPINEVFDFGQHILFLSFTHKYSENKTHQTS